jgi:hypothetical protein
MQTKGRHRKKTARRRGTTALVAGIIGASAGAVLAASPASAATSVVPDTAIASAASAAGLAGCHGVPVSTWVAIALAESGGNQYAHATVGEDSRGLWQINMRAHAGWVGNRDLYDPATNAWAASQVCKGSGPSAWSTYTNGAYRSFLGRGAAAANASGAGYVASAVSVKAAPSGGAINANAWYLSMSNGNRVPDATRTLQQKLADLGYPISVDGDFGPQTNHMVRDFQAKHGLVVDGVVGPQTHGALFG